MNAKPINQELTKPDTSRVPADMLWEHQRPGGLKRIALTWYSRLYL